MHKGRGSRAIPIAVRGREFSKFPERFVKVLVIDLEEARVDICEYVLLGPLRKGEEYQPTYITP